MIEVLSGLVLAIGVLLLSVVVSRQGDAICRGVDRWSEQFSELLKASSQQPSGESAASSQLVERVEGVERRVELALSDLNKQLRRLGQRSRHLESQWSEEEPAQEELELAQQLQRNGSPSPAPSPSDRPRLRRR